MPARKCCFVPICKNTTHTTPDKTFLTVPRDAKRRQKWFAAVRRGIAEVSEKSTLYCCEDHFKLEEDMENYMEYKLSKVSARFKPSVVPHLFTCRLDNSGSKKIVRESSVKRSQKKLVADFIKEYDGKMKTKTTDEMKPEEIHQLAPIVPSTSRIAVQRREVACQTKTFHFRSKGIQVDLKMKDAGTSPLKTVVSDLRKSAVKRAVQFKEGAVKSKRTTQPVETDRKYKQLPNKRKLRNSSQT
ncbi:hypothetical protein RI129_009580 [Pyrocoelia pectoralis]|uniref:THAP-type domain-containing protein n=1 Tax=Pyrocoelia pectoralis TaxID=417401 RepID=A0AAN7ZJ31_9COLE